MYKLSANSSTKYLQHLPKRKRSQLKPCEYATATFRGATAIDQGAKRGLVVNAVRKSH